MSRTLRLRWQGDAPRVGEYLLTPRGRGAYLILGIKDRGQRGGLGEPVFNVLVATVERVPRAEAIERGAWTFYWDRRGKKPRPLG